MKITYRPELDGMRAIAVIAVLVYHLKIPFGGGAFLPGGFLGVDLFFVLSGFLITKILLDELLEGGRIDFGGFYSRRARRIMPPLLMVMAVSIPFAWVLLLPSELARFGESLLATLAFVSNVFWFFSLSDYGAQSGLLQPFLHTWSLAIEEQFYLLFPIVLIGLARTGGRRAIGFGILVLFLLSLVLTQVSTLWKPELSFFSPISRAWELLAGSGLAYLSRNNSGLLRANGAARFAPAFALFILMGYFLFFSLGAWPHPGLATVPVILASCALLWFAQPGDPVTKLLSTRALVFIGKLSYSIYLWHFPIFAFGRLSNIDGISIVDQLSWLVATLALSIAGYYLVERPFRFRIPTRAFALMISIAVGAIAVFGGLSRYSNVFTNDRLAHLDVLYNANSYDNEKLKALSWSVLDSFDPNETIEKWNAYKPSEREKNINWFRLTDSRKVLILGNSHSKDVFNSMYLNAGLFDGIEFARFALAGSFPQDQFEALLRSPNFEESDVIAIAPKYGAELVARIPAVVETLTSYGKEVVIIGNTAEFKSPSSLPVFDWYLRRSGNETNLSQLNSVAYRYEESGTHRISRKLRQIAEKSGVRYLSRRDLICNDANQTCALITPNGRKSMYDYGHWTLEGARYFGGVAAKEGWFR